MIVIDTIDNRSRISRSIMSQKHGIHCSAYADLVGIDQSLRSLVRLHSVLRIALMTLIFLEPSCTTSTVLTLSGISPRVDFTSLSLSSLERLVLAHAPPSSHQAAYDDEDGACDDRPTSSLVSRFLGTEEEIRCKPVRDRRYTICEGNQGSSLGSRAWHHSGFPGELDLMFVSMVSLG